MQNSVGIPTTSIDEGKGNWRLLPKPGVEHLVSTISFESLLDNGWRGWRAIINISRIENDSWPQS